MSELPVGQLVAAFIATVFVLIGALGILRLTRVMTVVLVVSLLGIPTAGFVAYAIDPQPLNTDLNLILLAFPFVGVGLAAAIVTLAERLPRRPSQSTRSVQRSALAVVLIWGCLVAAISDFLFLFEPGFAEFNLYANALWFLGWLPRSWRAGKSEYSLVIGAPPETLFAFIADPANWPRYVPDIELVSVSPPLPLTVGSRVVLRRRVDYRGLRGPRLLAPDAVESTALFTTVDVNLRTVSRNVDLNATVTTELDEVEGGTRLTVRNELRIPYRLAVLGAVVELWVGAARTNAARMASWRRLKELLEQQEGL